MGCSHPICTPAGACTEAQYKLWPTNRTQVVMRTTRRPIKSVCSISTPAWCTQLSCADPDAAVCCLQQPSKVLQASLDTMLKTYYGMQSSSKH
jgi:hypothetical protein